MDWMSSGFPSIAFPSIAELPLPELETAIRIGVVIVAVALVLVAWRVDRPHGRWGAFLRKRFVLGLPWGTLVSLCGVLAVYLFVQGGLQHWYRPLTIPFSSWSYLYPLGWLSAPFSHAGPGHLLGNLFGTIAIAPLAEYYFSHFPTRRGTQSFSSFRTNPWARAFVLFPGGVFLVGILSSVFAWGPVIGFSGVVFAFVGFALVRYPFATIVALTAQNVVQSVYSALRNPIVVAEAQPSFSEPWWAGIAIQGHALGLFLGVLLGVLLLQKRDNRPSGIRLLTGSVLAGTSLSLWAIWWFRGGDTYVLHRGLGIIVVAGVSLAITVAALSSQRPLFGNVTRRHIGLQFVLIPLLVMGMVAVPFNLTTVTQADETIDSPEIAIHGYTVSYGENVPFEQTSSINISLFGETTQIETSGVIVTNDQKHIWTRELSKSRLAFKGTGHIILGGIGWRETIDVQREGWKATGARNTYQVWMRAGDDPWMHSYTAEAVQAKPVIGGRNISIIPGDGEFFVAVSQNETSLGQAQIPDDGNRTSVAGIQFVREKNSLIAIDNRTRVSIATKETYQ